MRFGLRSTWSRRSDMAEFDIDIAHARAGVTVEMVSVPGSYLLLLEQKFEKLGQCREMLRTVQQALTNVDGSVYEIIALTDRQEILTEGEYAVRLEGRIVELKESARRHAAAAVTRAGHERQFGL